MNFNLNRLRNIKFMLMVILMGTSTAILAESAPPQAPALNLTIKEDGALLFSWKRVVSTTYYRLMVDEHDNGNFHQIGQKITATSRRYHPPKRDLLSDTVPHYRVDACNTHGCTPSNITSEMLVRMLNAPMDNGLQKSFDDILNGVKKK